MAVTTAFGGHGGVSFGAGLALTLALTLTLVSSTSLILSVSVRLCGTSTAASSTIPTPSSSHTHSSDLGGLVLLVESRKGLVIGIVLHGDGGYVDLFGGHVDSVSGLENFLVRGTGELVIADMSADTHGELKGPEGLDSCGTAAPMKLAGLLTNITDYLVA